MKKLVSSNARFGDTPEERATLVVLRWTAHPHDDRPRTAGRSRKKPSRSHAGPERTRGGVVAVDPRRATSGRWSVVVTTSGRSDGEVQPRDRLQGPGPPDGLGVQAIRTCGCAEPRHPAVGDHSGARLHPPRAPGRVRGTRATPIPARVRPAAPTSSKARSTRTTRCMRSSSFRSDLRTGSTWRKRLGVTTPLDAFPSAVLGANDVTALDMASVVRHAREPGCARQPGLHHADHESGRDGRCTRTCTSRRRRWPSRSLTRSRRFCKR